MSDGVDNPTDKAPAGWYPDPWTPTRRRYWNGTSWTFASTVPVPVDHPPPQDAGPLPEGHGLPDPVAVPPGTARAKPPKPPRGPQKKWKWALAVVIGLLVGTVGVVMSNRSTSKAPPSESADPGLGTEPTLPPSSGSPTDNNDPSASALSSLVVKPEDVPSTARVVLFPGGVGLGQPTLDLCNGRYPSESRRTARIQDAALDAQGTLALSTEAVLYGDSAGTSQAFAELKSVTAACPSTPVQGSGSDPPEITTFRAPPDAGWAQTPTVNRLAYDLTSDDGSGQPRHTIAVYLQRGRALLGVYFAAPDGDQVPVQGQTTIEGIVGVFAARLAALPTSVVGA